MNASRLGRRGSGSRSPPRTREDQPVIPVLHAAPCPSAPHRRGSAHHPGIARRELSLRPAPAGISRRWWCWIRLDTILPRTREEQPPCAVYGLSIMCSASHPRGSPGHDRQLPKLRRLRLAHARIGRSTNSMSHGSTPAPCTRGDQPCTRPPGGSPENSAPHPRGSESVPSRTGEPASRYNLSMDSLETGLLSSQNVE